MPTWFGRQTEQEKLKAEQREKTKAAVDRTNTESKLRKDHLKLLETERDDLIKQMLYLNKVDPQQVKADLERVKTDSQRVVVSYKMSEMKKAKKMKETNETKEMTRTIAFMGKHNADVQKKLALSLQKQKEALDLRINEVRKNIEEIAHQHVKNRVVQPDVEKLIAQKEKRVSFFAAKKVVEEKPVVNEATSGLTA